MATVLQAIEKLERHYGAERVFVDRFSGRWCFYTLGGTISWAGKTRASAEKKMRDWDADSAYWEAYHAGKCK